MCDSWGEPYRYIGKPGQFSGAPDAVPVGPNLVKNGAHWGLIDNCRRMRRYDQTGNILYQGDFISEKSVGLGLISAIVKKGLDQTEKCLEEALQLPDESKCLLDFIDIYFINKFSYIFALRVPGWV